MVGTDQVVIAPAEIEIDIVIEADTNGPVLDLIDVQEVEAETEVVDHLDLTDLDQERGVEIVIPIASADSRGKLGNWFCKKGCITKISKTNG